MNMTIEGLQQQILANSGELFNSNLLGGSSAYNNVHPDTLAQLLRSSEFIHNENNNNNTSSSSLSAQPANSTYQLGDLFPNPQMFKSFPEGIYSYLNPTARNGEEADRGSSNLPPSLSGSSNFDNNKFLKWMNTMDECGHNFNPYKHKTSGDQTIPPLSLSPDNISVPYAHNGIGMVPNLSGSISGQGSINAQGSLNAQGSINAQGSLVDEEKDKPPIESGKRRASPDVHIIDGDKAVKKKRRQEKNREAAQLFRQRQKAKVHELERAVDELTCNNTDYRMKMEILAFENKILKDQLFYLKNLVSSGILITSMPNVPAFPAVTAPPPVDKGDASTLAINNPPPSLVNRGSPLLALNNMNPRPLTSVRSPVVLGAAPTIAQSTPHNPANNHSNSPHISPAPSPTSNTPHNPPEAARNVTST